MRSPSDPVSSPVIPTEGSPQGDPSAPLGAADFLPFLRGLTSQAQTSLLPLPRGTSLNASRGQEPSFPDSCTDGKVGPRKPADCSSLTGANESNGAKNQVSKIPRGRGKLRNSLITEGEQAYASPKWSSELQVVAKAPTTCQGLWEQAREQM